jgi:hypothetical protein
LELRNVAGAGWSDYWNSLDLAYGVSRNALSEMYVDDGSGRWDINGFRYAEALDYPNACTGPGETPQADFQPQAQQTISMHFYANYLVDGTTSWATKFKINLQKDMVALGITTSDFGSIQPATVIGILNNPTQLVLSAVPITSFANNGSGSYTISWSVPTGAQSYRIKWGAKQIVDWVGFDPVANSFTGDPVNTMPWFAATNVGNIPAPVAAGTVQSLTISTGLSGLTQGNFSVKAYAGGATAGAGPCDLNGDGVVNVVDVQIAILQALGITPCGNADLQGNGVCNVVDVQRVISAALGGACKVGL